MSCAMKLRSGKLIKHPVNPNSNSYRIILKNLLKNYESNMNDLLIIHRKDTDIDSLSQKTIGAEFRINKNFVSDVMLALPHTIPQKKQIMDAMTDIIHRSDDMDENELAFEVQNLTDDVIDIIDDIVDCV